MAKAKEKHGRAVVLVSDSDPCHSRIEGDVLVGEHSSCVILSLFLYSSILS